MRLVVIGGVAAGLSAAASARRADSRLDITVLEKGDSVSHGACGLPYFVAGAVASINDLVTYTPAYFQRERNITVRTGAGVESIEHGRRQVVLASGERLAYDRLVIATGALPSRDIDGADLPHVFTLNTPDDASRLREFLLARRPKTGLVIGAGYIGLEAAEALRAHAVRVRVVDRGSGRLASLVKKHVEQFGVEMFLGQSIQSISADPAEVVVLAAGLRPNVELAEKAGIRLGRTGAIQVTDRMETSLGAVYAAGDCAETTHIVSGQPVWLPLGTTANKMGRIAGANAAGARERFHGIAGTILVRIFGLGVGITGLAGAEARAAGFDPVSARIAARDRAAYFRSRPTSVELTADRRSGRLLGAVITGEHEVAGRVNVVATALASRMRLDDFAQLDLAYAPPYAPVWDPLLTAARQLLKQL